MTAHKPGRPSKYAPILAKIRMIKDPGWIVIDRNQANITAPSGMSARYPGWAFRCEKNDYGKYNLLALYVGNSDASGQC